MNDEKSDKNKKKYLSPFHKQKKFSTVLHSDKERNRFSNKLPKFDVTKENFPTLAVKKEDFEKKEDVVCNTSTQEDNKKLEKPEDSSFKKAVVVKKKKFATAPKYSIEPGWVKMRIVNGKIIKQYGPPVPRRQVGKRDVDAIHREIFQKMRENRRYWRDINNCGNGTGYNEYDDIRDYDQDDYYSDSDDNNGDSNDYDGY